MMNDLLKPGERLDDLHRNGFCIIQDPQDFCFGQDAVLLAGYTQMNPGEKALDLCAGGGIVSLLLAARYDNIKCYGIELMEGPVERASRSVRLNDVGGRVHIVQGDIKEAEKYFKPSSFDVVTVNPPYMNQNGGIPNPREGKAIARHELACTLEDVIRAAARLVKPGGKFYMIHRPHRMVDIFESMRQNTLEPKEVRLVFPSVEKPPSMVLVCGARGGRPMLKVAPPLVIYGGDGQYTEEVKKIYYG